MPCPRLPLPSGRGPAASPAPAVRRGGFFTLSRALTGHIALRGIAALGFALLSAPVAFSAPLPPPAPMLAPVVAPILPGARLDPIAFSAIAGWDADTAAAAFPPFLSSCGALAKTPAEVGPSSNAALVPGLRQACADARALVRALGNSPPSDRVARLFFAANFRAYRIVPEAQPNGFLTGYYEVEVDGSAVKTDAFSVPVYARPPDLIPTAPPSESNRGGAQRRVGDALVPYHDRAAIEDGALAGKGLEIVYLAHPVDLFFMQIQGSGRIRLTDGRVLRLNYDGHNGYPYLPVGRLLIQRGLVPREQMSMDRIRAYIEGDAAAGRALMRENRSFVFFKAVDLPPGAGPLGAQGVPLTTDRSIAIDRHIHAYGTPFFLAADLPLNGAGAPDVPLRRLMIAQDTGSAIVGPARADLYFGAGPVAGSISGGIRHPGTFTLLVPRFAPVPGARP